MKKALIGVLLLSLLVTGFLYLRFVPGKSDNESRVVTANNITNPLTLENVDTIFMAAQRPLNVVALPDRRFHAPTKGPEFQRELVREAMLIAARDEIGALTRDELLGEACPQNNHTLALRFFYVMPGEENGGGPLRQLSFRRLDSGEKETQFLDYDYTLWIRDPSDYMRILCDVERMSREDFTQSLKQAGVKKFDVPATETTNLEESLKDIDLLLEQMSIVPQFDAVRQIHQRIRETGESVPLLQRLVMGYTHLYLLSEHHFLKARFVFQSRALLYAQRIVAKYGETPEHLALRGAVLSYITYFKMARDNFELADRKKKENPPAHKALSEWMEIGRAYADYDFSRMETLVKEYPENSVAKLVHYLMHEYTLDSKTAQNVGREMTASRACMRIFDGMAGISSFDPILAPGKIDYVSYYAQTLPHELSRVRDMPQSVMEAAKTTSRSSNANPLTRLFGVTASGENDESFLARKRILDAFHATTEEDNACEMSWSALAHLIREESVLQIFHVAKGILGHNGDSSSMIRAAAPVFQGHPLEKALRCVIRGGDSLLSFKDEIADETPRYSLIDITVHPLWNYTTRYGQTNEKTKFTPDEMAIIQIDVECYRDLYFVWKITDSDRRLIPPSLNRNVLAKAFRRNAPESPLSIVAYIDHDWEYDEQDVD